MKNRGVLLNSEMDLDVKVTRDENGKIAQGLPLGDTTDQNITLILKMQPGELKEHPALGVGIDNMLLDHNELYFKHRIRQHLSDDDIEVRYLEIENEKININADYK